MKLIMLTFALVLFAIASFWATEPWPYRSRLIAAGLAFLVARNIRFRSED